MMGKTFVSSVLFVLSLTCIYCCATISPFDQYVYAQVTAVKVDVLKLMDQSNEPYQSNEAQIGDINTRLLKIIEYEKHRPKNGITTKMWSKLFEVDSDGQYIATSIIPSYWLKWKKDGKEGQFFITQAKEQVAEGFDLIAQLESKKIKPADTQVNTFLSK